MNTGEIKRKKHNPVLSWSSPQLVKAIAFELRAG